MAYQPQLDSWNLASRLTARAAVAIKAPGAPRATFGVISFSAQTQVDKETRQVALENFTITKVNFPSAPAMASSYQAALQLALPLQTARIARS